MELQRTLNSQRAGIWALRISQFIPPRMGHWLANRVASWISTRKDLPLVRAIRLNQWVARGCGLNSVELDRASLAVLQHIASSYYTLFRHIDQPDWLRNQVVLSPQVESLITESQNNRNGLVIAGVHMGNFDLLMQAAAWRGLKALAISLPEDTENIQAVEWQHQFRRQAGLEILPASLSNFRRAIRHLKDGGMVLTGVDRPIPSPKQRPLFLGFPASVPIHYIPLALEADVPLVLLASVHATDGHDLILSSDQIKMRRFKDHQKEILWNAECVLEAAAGFIQPNPEQWLISQPVWPEMIHEMP